MKYYRIDSSLFRRRNVRPVLFTGLLLIVLGSLQASVPFFLPDKTQSTSGSSQPQGNELSFFMSKTQLRLGHSGIICFAVQSAPSENHFYSFRVDQRYLKVLMPPAVLPGEKIGYRRLRPIQEGQTTLFLEGATLDIQITSDAGGSLEMKTRPQIVSPCNQAVVWGTITVGVEQLNLSVYSKPPIPILRLPNGQEIAGKEIPEDKVSPHLHYAYPVDTRTLPVGPLTLTVLSRNEQGRETLAEPLVVQVIHPSEPVLIRGDCKDQIHAPRPKSAGDGVPQLIADAKSGTTEVVANWGENPVWCLPVNLASTGLYQLLVTARGDLGAGALPTLGLMVDEIVNPVTTSRLASSEWHRTPVGHPIRLEAGAHTLAVRYRNDFSGGVNDDRNLYLAHYELIPVDNSPHALPDKDRDQMMMAGAPMKDSAMALGQSRVFFRELPQDQSIAGLARIEASCWWPERNKGRPPVVELWMNQHLYSKQTSAQPVFEVAPANLVPGANKLQLKALFADGGKDISLPATVELPPELAPRDRSALPYSISFRVWDAAWDPYMKTRIEPQEPETAAFYTNGEATLTLPEELEGEYQLFVEARGTDFKGPALIRLLQAKSAYVDGVSTVPDLERLWGEAPAPAFMSEVKVAQAHFTKGSKKLILRFGNDLYEEGKGVRNLWVKGVRLVRVDPLPDKTPPVVTILYPAGGQKLFGANVVVGHVAEDRVLAGVDLWVDDQAQAFHVKPRNGLGPVVIPLSTRALSPGGHRLRLVARDQAGNLGQSSEVFITVTASAEQADPSYTRAVNLLNRLGYGPEPGELAEVLTKGPHAWLAARLEESLDSLPEQNLQELLHAQYKDPNQVVIRALHYLINDPNPVRCRLLMWTENHFSTWLQKDGAVLKSEEHDRFLELGPACFTDLLMLSATSPAMLTYLDQRNSFAKRLNENYAREIMELHTLGVKGGYTQTDVTTLADLLTGWTVSDEAPMDGSSLPDRLFRYDPYLNSGSPCRVLGMEFPGVPVERRFDRVLMAMEMLSAYPSCADFVSRKLLEHYVSDPAPDRMVEALSRVYLETGGDLRQMLLAMIDLPDFWTSPPKTASPMDYALRLARLCNLNDPSLVRDLTSRSGMGLFDRATPDGYPEADGYFMSTNALLQRWHFAQALPIGFLKNGSLPEDLRAPNQPWSTDKTQRLVDLAAIRMTGSILSPRSNTSVMTLLASTPENFESKLRVLVTFLGQLPESSLR